MIVDTMTFDEITEHLLKTIFSLERITEVYMKQIVPKEKKYQREIIKWRRNCNHSQYRIFKPIISKNDYEEELVYVPFCADKKHIDCILFTTIKYKRKKYVAFKLTNNQVIFYSWHSLMRYSERFLNELEPIIDTEFIADMLIYNTGYQRTTYTHKGRLSKMYVSTDGGFLCEEYVKCVVANTFISHNEYFSNQEQLDKVAFEQLKKHKKEIYGYWIDRAS